MNLISCDHCGTVIDLNKITIPKPNEENEQLYHPDEWVWEDRDYIPLVPCGACKRKFPYRDYKGT